MIKRLLATVKYSNNHYFYYRIKSQIIRSSVIKKQCCLFVCFFKKQTNLKAHPTLHLWNHSSSVVEATRCWWFLMRAEITLLHQKLVNRLNDQSNGPKTQTDLDRMRLPGALPTFGPEPEHLCKKKAFCLLALSPVFVYFSSDFWLILCSRVTTANRVKVCREVQSDR